MTRSPPLTIDKPLGRRRMLAALGGLGGLLLLACGDDDDGSSPPDGNTSSGSSTGGNGSSGTGSSSGSIDANGFAVGSGAYLADADYDNPFTDEGGSCTVFVAATEGPCHSNTYHVKDITDGLVGLPTRIDLRVVDAACNPLSGAIVEIWYASPAGTYSRAAEEIDDDSGYSGSLSDLNVGFCTGNDTDALASKWLRGFQISGDDGRVQFDGIFPGWYSGRTPHIHFVVTVGGQRKVVSQLVFDEALTTAIYTKHGAYSSRGDKDTTNASDNVVGRGGLSAEMALMEHAQQEDGALLVWKTIPVA